MRPEAYVILALAAMACGTDKSKDRAEETDEFAESDAFPQDTWNMGLPATDSLPAVRDYRYIRSVIHLHSPFSHDACDGNLDKCEDDPTCDPKAEVANGYEGLPQWCFDDLKNGLCNTRFDIAFVTDHPGFAVYAPFDKRIQPEPADKLISDDQGVWGSERACDDGHSFYWRVGFEAGLLPIGMRRPTDEDPEVARATAGAYTPEAIAKLEDAGATVMLAHLEERDVDQLKVLQDAGLHGLEIFSTHAAMAPNIRQDAFGWSGLGWFQDAQPFLDRSSDMPPDLFLLAVLEPQPPTIDNFNTLTSRLPMLPTFGTDAHEDVIPTTTADGERADSYRRMLRWGSTMLLAKDRTPAAIDDALAAKRGFVVIELLGTPAGFDFRIDHNGSAPTEMGGTSSEPGTLVVTCPTLANGSPHGAEDPVLDVRVLKDGQPFQTGCGSWPVAETGSYRVEVWQTPNHLKPFIDDDLEAKYIKPYPWIYSGVVQLASAGG